MCLSKETRRAIEAALGRKGMRQVDLARAIGKSRSYVNNVLAGRDTISMKMADKIVKALGCRIRVVLEDKK